MTPTDEARFEDMDEQAAAWFSRARSGSMNAGEQAGLEAWLDADPAHQAAYDAVERSWEALGLVRAHPRMLAMRDEAVRPWRRAPVRWIAAACLALAVLGGGGFVGWRMLQPEVLLATQTWRTGPDERAVFTLPDGSEVTLNSGSVLRTRADDDDRLLYLDRGQAYFHVAKDAAHPFVVHAAGRKVTALDTTFEVRLDQRRFAVTLVEGKVRVEAPAPAAPILSGGPADAPPQIESTDMIAGSQLVSQDTARWTVSRTDTAQATGWAREQLVFEAEPLAEVVARMNRRSMRKIIITDPAVGEIPVSGNFRPGDVEGLARAVQAYGYARISAETAARIELSAG